MFEHLDGCRFSIAAFEEPVSFLQSTSMGRERLIQMNLSNCEIKKKKGFNLALEPVNAEILHYVEKMPGGGATWQFLGHGPMYP